MMFKTPDQITVIKYVYIFFCINFVNICSNLSSYVRYEQFVCAILRCVSKHVHRSICNAQKAFLIFFFSFGGFIFGATSYVHSHQLLLYVVKVLNSIYKLLLKCNCLANLTDIPFTWKDCKGISAFLPLKYNGQKIIYFFCYWDGGRGLRLPWQG